jgi:arylsulfatase A-like enzyme
METHRFSMRFEEFDYHLQLFLKSLTKKPNTLVVIWSDHGAHYGRQYENFQGFS